MKLKKSYRWKKKHNKRKCRILYLQSNVRCTLKATSTIHLSTSMQVLNDYIATAMGLPAHLVSAGPRLDDCSIGKSERYIHR